MRSSRCSPSPGRSPSGCGGSAASRSAWAMAQAPERPALEFDDASQVVAALRDKGHRVSASARAVLDALFNADGPVSADDIAAGGTELTSVYRNLERLQELGV